jgi:hypothetical protein
MTAELFTDLVETILVNGFLLCLAFVLGACWHHWHIGEEGHQ